MFLSVPATLFSSSASEYLRNICEQLFGRLTLLWSLISPPIQSELTVKTNKCIYTCKSCRLYACVYADPHVSHEAVDWTETRIVWAQTGCPTLPSVGRLWNKKINKDTPYKSNVTHQLCPSSSAQVKMIPLGKWHWLDPLCWFTSDPHWCTRFCASKQACARTKTCRVWAGKLQCSKTLVFFVFYFALHLPLSRSFWSG